MSAPLVSLWSPDGQGADDVIRAFRRAVAFDRMVGDGDLESCRLQALGSLMRLGRMDRAQELDAIQRHRCAWNADEYCTTCGADGRA